VTRELVRHLNFQISPIRDTECVFRLPRDRLPVARAVLRDLLVPRPECWKRFKSQEMRFEGCVSFDSYGALLIPRALLFLSGQGVFWSDPALTSGLRELPGGDLHQAPPRRGVFFFLILLSLNVFRWSVWFLVLGGMLLSAWFSSALISTLRGEDPVDAGLWSWFRVGGRVSDRDVRGLWAAPFEKKISFQRSAVVVTQENKAVPVGGGSFLPRESFDRSSLPDPSVEGILAAAVGLSDPAAARTCLSPVRRSVRAAQGFSASWHGRFVVDLQALFICCPRWRPP